MYEDQISVLLERGHFTWQQKNKEKNHSRLYISKEYMVDFELMRQINIRDLSKQRPIKRGAPGVRTVRPNDDRFTDNTKFLVQNFRAITLEKKEGESGGHWLGQQYKKKH